MWAIVHMLSGMAIGAVVPGGLFVGVVAALLAHLLLDLVPHWDYTRLPSRYVWGALDVATVAATALLAHYYAGLPAKVVWCGLASAAPDLDILNSLLPYKRRTRWFPSHWSGYPHGKTRPLPGIAIQLAVAAISLWVVGTFA